MSKVIKQMEQTMADMLKAEGYVVQFRVLNDCFTATVRAMPDRAIMVLKYPATMTPGEIVFAVRSILNTLNGK